MPNHQLIREATFTSSNGYNKFINWVSGEFDLYLQDKSNGLDVFFPNGKLNIKKAIDQDNTLVAKINFESKLQNQGTDIINKIMALYNQLVNTSKINLNPLI
jgi:hypothetical protein